MDTELKMLNLMYDKLEEAIMRNADEFTCHDPATCDEEHNLCGDEDHHYGCECTLCVEHYRSLK